MVFRKNDGMMMPGWGGVRDGPNMPGKAGYQGGMWEEYGDEGEDGGHRTGCDHQHVSSYNLNVLGSNLGQETVDTW